jgi:hypothetical protein
MRIAEMKLKKQSQFSPGVIDVKPFVKGDYGKNPLCGAQKNKANQSHLKGRDRLWAGISQCSGNRAREQAISSEHRLEHKFVVRRRIVIQYAQRIEAGRDFGAGCPVEVHCGVALNDHGSVGVIDNCAFNHGVYIAGKDDTTESNYSL